MSHYFDTPDGPEKRRTISVQIWDEELDFVTASGVFSATRLDPGTAVLLRESDAPLGARRIADVGCGFGPIAIALALNCPTAQIDAVDVNDRALALTAENAANHLVAERVHTLRPDQVDPEARYDQIWSNPPIRVGKATLHELLLEWLPRLAPGGEFRMVVGKNLGADSLQRWIIEMGWECERVASAKGFRVLVAKAPSAVDAPVAAPVATV